MTTPKIKVNLPQAFEKMFEKWRYKVFYGGRGSSKSWSIATYLVLMVYQNPNTRVLCTREIQNSIKESVHKLIADSIDRMGLSKFFHVTNSSITCVNGSEFFFMGLLRNVDQIKSTEGVNYCWVSEAHNVSSESWDILLPTIRAEDSEIIVDFNPRYEDDPTYQKWVVNAPPNCLSVLVNYTDNPYFPEVLRTEMEHDKAKDILLYEQKWLGKPVGVGGRVWPSFDVNEHVKVIEIEDIAKEGMAVQSIDPHSHFYPACLWIAIMPVNKRGNWPEDFHMHVYNEWPTVSDLNAPYHEQRKKITYTGNLADISREIYSKDGLGVKIAKRSIDTRYAKGSGGWNWSTSTQGIVEEFAKKDNGGLVFSLPPEKQIDIQRQVIQSFMEYNTFAPVNEFNKPRFSVDPKCKNLILSLKNHRLEEDPHRKGEMKEKEAEKYKDFSDALRIGSAIIEKYESPNKEVSTQRYMPRRAVM